MAQRWKARLLGPAIEATRAYLAELEDEQIPHALRPIVASSARRLPPPLAAVVIRELERSDDLRSHVAPLLADGDATVAELASQAFVIRPEGWEALMESYEADEVDRQSGAQIDRLSERVAELESDVAKAREKLKEAKRSARADAAEAREKISGLKRRLADLSGDFGPDRSGLREQLEVARGEQQALSERVARSEKLVATLRAKLLRARRSRGTGQPGPGFDRVGPRPLDLAKSLDAMAVIAAVEHAGGAPPASQSSGLALPPGVRPDSPEAMDWVVQQPAPVTIVIDGYNAAWLIDAADFSSAKSRQEVVRRAGLLRRAAVAPSKVMVVFDSEHGQAEPIKPGPVAIRWAESADDEIRALAASLAGDVVVVTTDREVQEGSLEHGAIVLWSEAFVGWAAR